MNWLTSIALFVAFITTGQAQCMCPSPLGPVPCRCPQNRPLSEIDSEPPEFGGQFSSGSRRSGPWGPREESRFRRRSLSRSLPDPYTGPPSWPAWPPLDVQQKQLHRGGGLSYRFAFVGIPCNPRFIGRNKGLGKWCREIKNNPPTVGGDREEGNREVDRDFDKGVGKETVGGDREVGNREFDREPGKDVNRGVGKGGDKDEEEEVDREEENEIQGKKERARGSAQEVNLGPLRGTAHNVSADAFIIKDEKTIHIKNLVYDGTGPDAFFLVGKGLKPHSLEGTVKVPDENGSLSKLHAYYGKDITLRLPRGLTIRDIDWFSLFCIQFQHNFGHIMIPEDLFTTENSGSQ